MRPFLSAAPCSFEKLCLDFEGALKLIKTRQQSPESTVVSDLTCFPKRKLLFEWIVRHSRTWAILNKSVYWNSPTGNHLSIIIVCGAFEFIQKKKNILSLLAHMSSSQTLTEFVFSLWIYTSLCIYRIGIVRRNRDSVISTIKFTVHITYITQSVKCNYRKIYFL